MPREAGPIVKLTELPFVRAKLERDVQRALEAHDACKAHRARPRTNQDVREDELARLLRLTVG